MAAFLFCAGNFAHVRYQHKADMQSCTAHVRFGGKADIAPPKAIGSPGVVSPARNS